MIVEPRNLQKCNLQNLNIWINIEVASHLSFQVEIDLSPPFPAVEKAQSYMKISVKESMQSSAGAI